MSDLIRDAPIGQMVRWVTKGKMLQYAEEKPGFQVPSSYGKHMSEVSSPGDIEKPDPLRSPNGAPTSNHLSNVETRPDYEFQQASATEQAELHAKKTLSVVSSRSRMDRVTTRQGVAEAYRMATQQESLQKVGSQPIIPQKTADGVILVDWYTTDDPENPQNWSSKKKGFAVLQIYVYTLAVYLGSAIYTASEGEVMRVFNVSQTKASLGLALYVFGYGLGPLFFSPLSEIPIIGRNPPYMVTFGIFVAISIPTAIVNDYSWLMALRFFQGFFGSPCLATGGASIGDLYTLLKMPYFLTGWAGFATAGPALGPLISGFSVPAKNWHWSLWEIVWLAGPIFVSLVLFLPETSSPNILLRRAKRLRNLTGNPLLRSQSEIDQANTTVNAVIIENLWRPLQINLLDPAVLFTSVYTAIIYGIYYSFFEVFPIVYGAGQGGNYAQGGYGMNLGQMGLVFLCISVGVAIAIPTYFVYLRYVFEPEIKVKGMGPPEVRLVPAIFASFLLPVGLFLFAWTGKLQLPSTPKTSPLSPIAQKSTIQTRLLTP